MILTQEEILTAVALAAASKSRVSGGFSADITFRVDPSYQPPKLVAATVTLKPLPEGTADVPGYIYRSSAPSPAPVINIVVE